MPTPEHIQALVAEHHRLAEQIIALVAEYYGLTPSVLLGRARTPSVAWARQVAMWLLREARPHMSLSEIGQAFDRDHTTVLHAVAQVRAALPDPTTIAELQPLAVALGLPELAPPTSALSAARRAADERGRLAWLTWSLGPLGLRRGGVA